MGKAISKLRFERDIITLTCLPLLVLLSSCNSRSEDTSPPDLTDCTSIEIRWPRGIVESLLGDVRTTQNIISPEEREYIKSLEPYEVNDFMQIKAFANIIRQGTYLRHLKGRLAYSKPIHVTWYSGSDHRMFTVYGRIIVTEDQGMFEYSEFLSELPILMPPKVQSFKLRYQCASNLANGLYGAGPLWNREVKTYPVPSTWCDVVVRALRTRCSNETITRIFICPIAHIPKDHDNYRDRPDENNGTNYISNYAMNPNCEPNSPPDIVLLFETKAGWNQHGGPELFTFDNHDPKGGCVLLNDGTVKFIRTEEELHQLRWK